MNYIHLSKLAHFIKDLDQLFIICYFENQNGGRHRNYPKDRPCKGSIANQGR